jgi:hypothetical protein
MASSTYDLNVQLALATTAAHEGDLGMALDFLAQAQRLAREAEGAGEIMPAFVDRQLRRSTHG